MNNIFTLFGENSILFLIEQISNLMTHTHMHINMHNRGYTYLYNIYLYSSIKQSSLQSNYNIYFNTNLWMKSLEVDCNNPKLGED